MDKQNYPPQGQAVPFELWGSRGWVSEFGCSVAVDACTVGARCVCPRAVCGGCQVMKAKPPPAPVIRLRPWGEADLPLLRALNTPEMTEHLGGPETEQQVAGPHRRYVDSPLGTDGHMFVIETTGGRPPGWSATGHDAGTTRTSTRPAGRSSRSIRAAGRHRGREAGRSPRPCPPRPADAARLPLRAPPGVQRDLPPGRVRPRRPHRVRVPARSAHRGQRLAPGPSPR